MAGAIGDINQGLVGISHTTGVQQNDMPTKKMVKPSAGSNITVHTESVLNLEDSGNHLMKFIRGDKLDSYSPQEQKELREGVMKAIEGSLDDAEAINSEQTERLKDTLNILKGDGELEVMAMMARNVLISA